MKASTEAVSTIKQYFQNSDILPRPQLRRLGLIYSSYRFIISLFFMMMVYFTAKSEDNGLLPSFLQQTALTLYVLLSLLLLGLAYVATSKLRWLLVYGMAIDVIVLSILLYTNGAPDIQLTMLYMVVVAASFMLLHSSQALFITLLAIIFVIYQQFFYAISNSMSLTNLGDALLISASFLAVGFLSWSISQRLVQVEKVAALHAREVKRLNVINKEVITQMVNGVIVVDHRQIVLANIAAYELLNLSKDSGVAVTNHHPLIESKLNSFIPFFQLKSRKQLAQYYEDNIEEQNQNTHVLSGFQQQLSLRHPDLLDSCLSLAMNQSRTFIYELPATESASFIGKLRVQITPLKDASQLIILEDLSREQASAQQLKLASLGQLTASIAHEIRNPLAAISQASQLLMEDVEDQACDDASTGGSESTDSGMTQPSFCTQPSDNHELYKMIFEQSKRVNRIIEDVLKLSKQHKAHLKPVELSTWMPQFITDYFHGHDVFLQLKAHPVIHFDANHLEQILINLINNGLRFSSYEHAHAYVEIEIYCIKNDVIIDVLDAGAGVKTADLQHLFNPFFTTDATGTGLGLYLSQAFCEANHARLLYVPEHPKTCFRIIAPIIDTSHYG